MAAEEILEVKINPNDPIYNTRYATNEVLVQEHHLPRMEIPAMGVIPLGVFVAENNHTDIEEVRSQEIHWTNDAPDSLNKYGWHPGWGGSSACNINRNVDDIPTEWYTYQCSAYKLCYTVPSNIMTQYSKQIDKLIQFTIDTPTYTETEYEYIHHCSLFGRQMITSNMYISYRLVERLEFEIKTWAKNKGCTFIRNVVDAPDVPMGATKVLGSHGPCQLITNVVESYDTTKLQMCIKPEYLYWVIETLIINLAELRELGLEAFKFSYLFGENRVLNILNETFPAIDAGPISTYRIDGKEYRREVLNSPNVVFYLKPLNTQSYDIRLLVDKLCGLFPNTMAISFGIPRFNIRVNNNVCISIGGNNQHKFDADVSHIPEEYRYIIDHPEKCEYRMLSRYLTGHDILLEVPSKCILNNIKSYEKVLSPDMRSFKQAFDSVRLSSYYDDIFANLDLAPIPMSGGRIRRRMSYKINKLRKSKRLKKKTKRR